MPTLGDLLERVSFLAAMPAVAGLLVTAGILVVNRDWRLNVIALTAQYFFLVLLLTRQIRLEVAAVKGLVGWLICMVFYMTERRAVAMEQARAAEGDEELPRVRYRGLSARVSFYLLAGLLVTVVAYLAAQSLPLPEVPSEITLAFYLMVGLGLLLVGLSEAPMQVGLGLLTFLSGFDLFYVALEPSLVVVGMLGAVNFLVALAVAYLRTVQVTARRKADTL